MNRPLSQLKIVIIILSLVLGSGLGPNSPKPQVYLEQPPQPQVYPEQRKRSPQPQVCLFGLAEFQQLRKGMFLTGVQSILLCRGIELESDGTIATSVWENSDGSKITVTFEHERLKSKKQVGLK